MKNIEMKGGMIKTDQKNMIFNKSTNQFVDIKSIKDDDIGKYDLQSMNAEQLKSIGFKEEGKIEYRVNKEGLLTIDKDDNDEEKESTEKLNNELRSYENIEENNVLGITNENMIEQIKALIPALKKKDAERSEIVLHALENGYEIDDPLYYLIFEMKEEFIKKRVQYLKIYFSGTPDKKKESLIKNIIETQKIKAKLLESDSNTIYQHESAEGKKLIDLGIQQFKQIEKQDKDSYQGVLSDEYFYNMKTEDNNDSTYFNSFTYVNDKLKELKGDQSDLGLEDDNKNTNKKSIASKSSNSPKKLGTSNSNEGNDNTGGNSGSYENEEDNKYTSGSMRSKKKNRLKSL